MWSSFDMLKLTSRLHSLGDGMYYTHTHMNGSLLEKVTCLARVHWGFPSYKVNNARTQGTQSIRGGRRQHVGLSPLNKSWSSPGRMSGQTAGRWPLSSTEKIETVKELKNDQRNSRGTLRKKFSLNDIWHFIFDIWHLPFNIGHSTNGPMDQCTNGPMDEWTNRPMDQRTNRPMEQWTYGLMDQ